MIASQKNIWAYVACWEKEWEKLRVERVGMCEGRNF